MADYGKLSRAMLAAAAKAADAATYRDPAATKIADWNWRPLADVKQEVPITAVPDYIQAGYGQFMKEQAKRAAANGLTDRDLLKAYLITQSSVGRGGLSHSTATKAGLKVPYATEVRPEGAFATWLGSPAGQRYLDAAQRGELDPKSMEDIRSKFAPFGKQNDLVDKMAGAVTAMPTMSPRLNEAITGSPEAYRDFAEELNGIAAAKSGFIGSLLGRGDLPTFDARQIGLHTSGMPMPTASAESMLRRGKGLGGREAVDRLSARQRAMGLDIDPSLDPHYQHLTHHAVWDALGGEKTTHQDLIDAMKNYAGGGPIHMAGAGSVTKGLMGALTKAAEAAAVPAVNRLDMNFKDVTKRIPELTEAANMVAQGEMNASQYDSLVRKLKPVTPYNFVPQPATSDDAMRALTENKRPMFGKTGEMSAGEQADLRLDIPAYKDHGVWVNSIHRKDQPTVYGSTSSVKNATMIGAPDKALKVAQGGPKAPFAVIRGEWNPLDEQKAVEQAQKYLAHPEWKQVGYDPERHGYFYDRSTMAPIIGADEVIQIGPLVLAKKPKYGKPEDFPFKEGGVIHMATAGGVSRGLVGALTRAAEAAEAVKPLSKEREATLPLSAQQMEANRAALDAAKPPIKASEAYGQFEGSYLKPIFYDRMKVDLANRKFGGPGFSGIQHVDPEYGNVGATAGVTDKKMSTRILNRNTANVPQGANVIWTPSVGSPEQHRSNTTMFNTFANRFTAQRDKMDKALLQKMSDRASAAEDNKGKLIFPDGIDLSARNFRQGVKTYPQRTVLADIFGGGGVGGEAGRTVNVESLLEKNLDPYMGQANTHDLGNRLFTLNGGIINDPKLHPDYPYILTGEDKKINYLPAPFRSVFDDYLKQKKLELLSQGKDREVTQMDYTKGDPTVQLTDTLLSRLQKEGYKKGGDVGHGLHEFMVNKIKKHIDENYDHVVPPKMANGGEVQRFDKGGSSVSDKVVAANRFLASLASQAKEQGEKEIGSLGKSGAVTDLLNRGVVAPTVGLPVDFINMGLLGIDTLSGKMGHPTRLSSEKPFGGSEQIKDLMNEYGVTSGEERPLMETGMSMFSPSGMLKSALSAAKVLPTAARAAESGLNATTSAVRRPFTPATATVEAVAPDLAKYKPASWQEMATNRLTGEGAPVSMETVGGRKTTKRAGQGVYVNNEGQLETNPMVAVDIPFAGSLSGNKALRGDIATVGQSLNQEAMAAHRFVPMATNNIKDATAMLIKPKGGNLTNEQVIQLGKTLGGDMVVAHNPRLGGVVVYPFGDVTKGQIPKEFLNAQSVGRDVLGKDFSVQYGKADPVKDRMFMGSGDYASEGARPTSPSTTTMRERIKRAEQRKFPKRVQSPAVPELESGG